MSINNIPLSPILIQELYSNVLVAVADAGTAVPGNETEPAFPFLGSNQKNITIAVRHPDALYLPDDDLQFLIGVLNACKLSMADIALVNIATLNQPSYTHIAEQLGAKTVLLFDVSPSDLQMPLQFPHYQVQQFNQQVYLTAPGLHHIAADKAEKTKLWNNLKKIFNIG